MNITYFIESLESDHVKIGATYTQETDKSPLDAVKRRYKLIQMYCPLTLAIIGYTDEFYENDLHRIFARYRKRGEWYMLNGVVRNTLRVLCSSVTKEEKQAHLKSLAEIL